MEATIIQNVVIEPNPNYNSSGQAPNIFINKEWKKRVRVVCISDTHNEHDRKKIPAGDILIHSGDFTDLGTEGELAQFNKFLSSQSHKYKIVIAGNHELTFPKKSLEDIKTFFANSGTTYLQDSGIEIEGLKLWGSPWTMVGMAYHGSDTPEGLGKKFELIPQGTQILITHNPPLNIMDLAQVKILLAKLMDACKICGKTHQSHKHWGSRELLQRIQTIQPKVHIFGHVHECPGMMEGTSGAEATLFLNVAQAAHPKPVFFDCYI